jgi:hypothetical protein
MTKIVLDFNGFENTRLRLEKLESIYDFWLGTGAYATAGTLGTIRTNLNSILPDDLINNDAFGSWLDKLNSLNEADKFISDSLSGTGPNSFILAHDTSSIFGANGTTFNTLVEAAALANADLANLQLGMELYRDQNPVIGNSGGTVGFWNSTTNTMTNTGLVVSNYPRFAFNLGLSVNSAYYVSGVVTGNLSEVNIIRLAILGTLNNITYNATTGKFSGVAVAASTSLQIVTDLNSSKYLTLSYLSVREVLNFTNYFNVPTPGRAVYIAADDWEGIELGAELNSDISFNTAVGWNPGAGWSITGGQAIKVAGAANALSRPAAVTQGKAYLLEIEAVSIVGTLTLGLFGGTPVYVGTITSPGRYRAVIVAGSGNTAAGLTVPDTVSSCVVNYLSVREILNWPAYQNTTTARPIWGRAPIQVRNLHFPSETATGWLLAGGASAPVDFGPAHGINNWIRYVRNGHPSIPRATGNPIRVTANTQYTIRFKVDKINSSWQGGFPTWQFYFGRSGSERATLRIDSATWGVSQIGGSAGVSISNSATITDNVTYIDVEWIITALVSENFVFGIWELTTTNIGDTINFSKVEVLTMSDVSGAYQRRGSSHPDVTEDGVPSFGVLSFDLSDDAIIRQIHTGGTVSVALFGRGGSYLIPSIVLAANDVLSIGPLSVLDNGIVVATCPTNILRAVGIVPWSSRAEIVGIAIMKENPTEQDRYIAMLYFASHGARGWLVESTNIITNGGFDTDLTGWTGFGSIRTWNAGTISMTTTDDINKGRFYRGSTDQVPKNTLMRWTCDLVSYLGNGSDARLRFGEVGSLNNIAPNAEVNLSLGTNTGFYVSDSQNRVTGVILVGGTQAGGGGLVVDNFFIYPYYPEF